MMDQATLLKQIRQHKKRFEPEGFHIVGLFGSAARGEMTEESDIDLLYVLDPSFIDRNGGFGSMARITEIAEEFEACLGRNIDLISKNHLGRIGKKYILPEAVDV